MPVHKATGNMYQEPLKMGITSDLPRSGVTVEKEYSIGLKVQIIWFNFSITYEMCYLRQIN